MKIDAVRGHRRRQTSSGTRLGMRATVPPLTYPTRRPDNWRSAIVPAVALLGLVGPLGARPAAPLAAVSPAAPRASSVAVTSNRVSGRPVGTTIIFTARAAGLANAVYRFSVRPAHGPTRIARDFSRTPTFAWTPLYEGAYTIQADAKADYSTASARAATTAFAVAARVTGTSAVVTALANPLVALYSAPACARGSVVVQFRPATGSTWRSTIAQPCVAGQNVNVIVAGMRPRTRYTVRHVVFDGGHVSASAQRDFTTGAPAAGLKIARYTVKRAAVTRFDPDAPFIFHALNPSPSPALANPIATNLDGQLMWYYDTLRSGLTMVWPLHMVAGGAFLMFGRDAYRKTGNDVLREVDLAGDTLRETSIDAVNPQLVARGRQVIYAFHHDALRLPNGDTAVLGETQKRVGGRNVMGDMIIVLDADFQVAWTWDIFDHLTPGPTFPPNQICRLSYPNTLCALPNADAEDWTHSNALGWSPADDDLTLSIRHLDLVLKIDYRAGRGNGAVVWKLGKDADFTLKSANPYPWFSHQHNVYYVNNTTLVLFDNGNSRCLRPGVKLATCHSRGQELALDERTRTATLRLNADLGGFRQALGSAQLLTNGDLLFGGGFPTSAIVEFHPDGTPVYEMDTTTPEYRDYRLGSLSY